MTWLCLLCSFGLILASKDRASCIGISQFVSLIFYDGDSIQLSPSQWEWWITIEDFIVEIFSFYVMMKLLRSWHISSWNFYLFCGLDFVHVHVVYVNGVRQCPQTLAISEPIIHPPDDV
jgi:hypothetical protein